MMKRLLSEINATRGVLGSFATNADGGLTAHQMPAGCNRSDLVLAASHAAKLLETGEVASEPAQAATINFGSQQLLIRRFTQGYLCALSLSSIDHAALDQRLQAAVHKFSAQVQDTTAGLMF